MVRLSLVARTYRGKYKYECGFNQSFTDKDFLDVASNTKLNCCAVCQLIGDTQVVSLW